MVQGRKPNLKRRRRMAHLRAQGLTYAEIGQRLGVSHQNVQRMIGDPRPRQAVPCSACGASIPCRRAVPHDMATVLCPACVANLPKATLGQRLRALRLAAGLTREALARQAGVGPSTLTGAERGTRDTRLGTAHKLAIALGTTAAALNGEEPLPLAPKRNSKPRKRH